MAGGRLFQTRGPTTANALSPKLKLAQKISVLELWSLLTTSRKSCVAGLVYGSSKHVGLNQRSYSTLDPVSAWVGDRLWTGTSPWRRTITHVYSLPLWVDAVST